MLTKPQIEFSAKTGTFYGLKLWEIDADSLLPHQLRDLITVIQLYNWYNLDKIDIITPELRQMLRDMDMPVYDEDDWLQ